MSDLLTKFSEVNPMHLMMGLLFVLVILALVIGAFAMGIIDLLYKHRRRLQLDEMEAALKMEMIERGMTADEIQQVLEARLSAGTPRSFKEWLGTNWFSKSSGQMAKRKISSQVEHAN